MTGAECEKYFCELAKQHGWWTLNIPRSASGQQPFDVIAVKDESILAVDCKVVSSGGLLLPLKRIENNQWLAFWSLRKRSEAATIGVVVWHDPTRKMYFIDYSELVAAVKAKQKSVPIIYKEVDRIELLRRASVCE